MVNIDFSGAGQKTRFDVPKTKVAIMLSIGVDLQVFSFSLTRKSFQFVRDDR
jgi:hypothetical protein